jgi:hypothetical protein
MADDPSTPRAVTYYDLEFHFTHGEPLSTTVQEGRDALVDTNPCTHCGRGGTIKVTVVNDGLEHTMTVHTDKLNAVQSTKRIVKPQYDLAGVLMEGE